MADQLSHIPSKITVSGGPPNTAIPQSVHDLRNILDILAEGIQRRDDSEGRFRMNIEKLFLKAHERSHTQASELVKLIRLTCLELFRGLFDEHVGVERFTEIANFLRFLLGKLNGEPDAWIEIALSSD
ncbi:hypothetical protein Dda_2404 [Drechslerella dactyloides]|uniref:Uncharacterized protein n=1 Tax=Drechslerella dactyloides TaxID=74499 RepID=A0AAD6J7G0_DREDA|nr:hypothetical protein Dda_2404 [Drechslerella dactyloides]